MRFFSTVTTFDKYNILSYIFPIEFHLISSTTKLITAYYFNYYNFACNGLKYCYFLTAEYFQMKQTTDLVAKETVPLIVDDAKFVQFEEYSVVCAFR